jgi:hypothetical protein
MESREHPEYSLPILRLYAYPVVIYAQLDVAAVHPAAYAHARRVARSVKLQRVPDQIAQYGG